MRIGFSPGYTSTFGGTENPVSESGKWVNGASVGLDWTNVRTTPGLAFADGQTTGYNDAIAHISTSIHTFTNNQWAEGTVYRAPGYAPTTKHEVELHLRWATSAHNAVGYEIGWGIHAATAYIFLVKWLGGLGSYTAVYDPGDGSIAIPQTGDVFRAEITGSALTVKLNGSIVTGFNGMDVTNSGAVALITSGQPGMGFWPNGGDTVPASYGWSKHRAGELP